MLACLCVFILDAGTIGVQKKAPTKAGEGRGSIFAGQQNRSNRPICLSDDPDFLSFQQVG